MKHVELSFVARVKLIGAFNTVPAGQNAPINKVRALSRISEMVEFAPDEMAGIVRTEVKVDELHVTTHYRIIDPEASGPQFGMTTLDLEDADAGHFAEFLEVVATGIPVNEFRDWLGPILAGLREPRQERQERREPQVQFKRRK
jgi:hypothetical protein